MTASDFFASKIVRYAVAGLTIFVSLSLMRMLYRSLQLTKVPEGNNEIVTQLEAEKVAVESQIADLDHPFTKEQIIRDELNMVLPGERVIQLPPIETTPSLPEPTPTPTQPPWQEWKQLLL